MEQGQHISWFILTDIIVVLCTTKRNSYVNVCQVSGTKNVRRVHQAHVGIHLQSTVIIEPTTEYWILDPRVTETFSYTPKMELSLNYSAFSCRVGLPVLTVWINPASWKTKGNREPQFPAQVAFLFLLIFKLTKNLPFLVVHNWPDEAFDHEKKGKPEVALTSFKWL